MTESKEDNEKPADTAHVYCADEKLFGFEKLPQAVHTPMY